MTNLRDWPERPSTTTTATATTTTTTLSVACRLPPAESIQPEAIGFRRSFTCSKAEAFTGNQMSQPASQATKEAAVPGSRWFTGAILEQVSAHNNCQRSYPTLFFGRNRCSVVVAIVVGWIAGSPGGGEVAERASAGKRLNQPVTRAGSQRASERARRVGQPVSELSS